jgi:hypothetical protein
MDPLGDEPDSPRTIFQTIEKTAQSEVPPPEAELIPFLLTQDQQRTRDILVSTAPDF